MMQSYHLSGQQPPGGLRLGLLYDVPDEAGGREHEVRVRGSDVLVRSPRARLELGVPGGRGRGGREVLGAEQRRGLGSCPAHILGRMDT